MVRYSQPGSKVDAKHSDGTYHSATIIRVTDASVYTVGECLVCVCACACVHACACSTCIYIYMYCVVCVSVCMRAWHAHMFA